MFCTFSLVWEFFIVYGKSILGKPKNWAQMWTAITICFRGVLNIFCFGLISDYGNAHLTSISLTWHSKGSDHGSLPFVGRHEQMDDHTGHPNSSSICSTPQGHSGSTGRCSGWRSSCSEAPVGWNRCPGVWWPGRVCLLRDIQLAYRWCCSAARGSGRWKREQISCALIIFRVLTDKQQGYTKTMSNSLGIVSVFSGYLPDGQMQLKIFVTCLNIDWTLGPCKGGFPSPPSEFQSLVCRYFRRFRCRCRNFDMKSLRLCWPSSEENFTRLRLIRQGQWSTFLSGRLQPTTLSILKLRGPGGICSPRKMLKFEFLNGWKSVQRVPVCVRMLLLCKWNDHWQESFFSHRVMSLSKRMKIQNSLSVHFLYVSLSEIPSSALSLVAIS